MRENEGMIEFEDVEVLHGTEKALCCLIALEEYWIPKSQISQRSEVQEKGDRGLLIITEWIADKKGLSGEESWKDEDEGNYEDLPF